MRRFAVHQEPRNNKHLDCPNCHRSAMSWLHIIVIIAFVLPTVFWLLRVF
jgi:hypothetical protein